MLPFFKALKDLGVKGERIEKLSDPNEVDLRIKGTPPVNEVLNWIGQLGWECFKIEEKIDPKSSFANDVTTIYRFKRAVSTRRKD